MKPIELAVFLTMLITFIIAIFRLSKYGKADWLFEWVLALVGLLIVFR